MTRLATLTLALTLLPASFVGAQCLEGRVATEQSGGRCCWPGQTWNDEAARCEGAPQCPDGFGGEGDQCVQLNIGEPAPTYPPAQPPASPQQYAPAQTAPQRPNYAHPVPPNRASWQPAPRPAGTEPIIGLAIAGGVSFGATYIATVIGTAFELMSCCNGEVGFNFIPVVGPVLYVATSSSRASGFGITMFTSSAVVQAVTLTLMAAGLIVQRPRRVRRAWQAELIGGPGDAGVGGRLYW